LSHVSPAGFYGDFSTCELVGGDAGLAVHAVWDGGQLCPL
jgi:hypothetical protein